MREPTSWIQVLVEGQAQHQLQTALLQLCCAQEQEAMIVDVICASFAEDLEQSTTPARPKKSSKKAAAATAATGRLPLTLAVEDNGTASRRPKVGQRV